MNKNILMRIFAIIGLIGAVGTAVFSSLVFFNLNTELSGIMGTLAVIFICIMAVFFILAYSLKPRGTDLGKPDDADEIDDAELGSGGETEANESDIDGDHNVVPDTDADEERKDEQD